MRFKMKPSRNGQWFFVIEAAGNYQTLATSEMYGSKSDCQHAIDLIKQGAAAATVHEEAGTPAG